MTEPAHLDDALSLLYPRLCGLEGEAGATSQGMSDADKSQLDKFNDAARELDADDDPERFKERLAKLVKHKPVPEKGE